MKKLLLILLTLFAATTLAAQDKKFMLKDGIVQPMRVYDSAAIRALINLKVNYTDTAAMLLAYKNAIAGKLNITDTAAMLAAYQTAINSKAEKATTLTINGTAYDLSVNRTWSVGTVTGSGTFNYVPKWTPSGTALGDSKLYDDGSYMRLGNYTTASRLGVNNNIAPAATIDIMKEASTDAIRMRNRGVDSVYDWQINPYYRGVVNTGFDIEFGGARTFGITAAGNVGIMGVSNSTPQPSARLHVISTTEQLRLGYDVSNYSSFTVSSGGQLTIDQTSGGAINLGKAIRIQGNSAGDISVSGSTLQLGATAVRVSSIIGGNATTSTLTYKTTTGVGTTGADHIFQVGNNGATEAMRILNNGNVGIGSSIPNTKLQIYDASNSTLSLTNVANTDNGLSLAFSSPNAYIYNRAAGFLQFATNNSPAMTILNGGNVGIGTTSPNYTAVDKALTLSSSTFGAFELRGSQTSNGSLGNISWVNAASSNYHTAAIQARREAANNSSSLNFFTSNAGTLNSNMVIMPSGNVGIGIASPTSKLETSAFAAGYVKVTADNYTILSTNYTVSVDNGANNWTVLLPDPTTCTGRIYIIKRFDNNSTGTVTVDSNGGNVQDGNTGAFGATVNLEPLGSIHASAMFQSNGTNWEAINH